MAPAMRAALAAAMLGLLGASTARAEWVVTLYTGVSHTYQSDVQVIQPATHSDATFGEVSWAPHSFTLGVPYFGLRVSYFRSSAAHVGATIDFTHYKMYAETAEDSVIRGTWNGTPLYTWEPISTLMQQLSAPDVNLVSLDGQYRWNAEFDDGPWEKHIGAGALVYLPRADAMINGTGVSSNYQYAGFGGQIFGGAAYNVPARMQPHDMALKRITLLVETKLNMGSLDMNLDPATRIDTRTTTVHLITGVSLHF